MTHKEYFMIKVVVVEDSLVVRENLKYILESDSDILVVGMANDGKDAVEMVRRYKPDVVTMDINMPKMNGFQATRRIMETSPVPIVVVSASWNPEEVNKTFQAMAAGAVSIIGKPRGIGHPDYERSARELIQTVKLMSEVKVVSRRPQLQPAEAVPAAQSRVELQPAPAEIKLVAVGVSTGGPVVLQTILSMLPKDFSVPVLIVQHIAKGFIQGLVDWLDQSTGFPVHVAADGEHILPGHAYFAPDDFHMEVSISKRISLIKGKEENNLRPSISCLFRSVANVFGPNAAGVLLTGMGNDGAEELKLMKEKGAVTIAQDKKTSLIFGMPGQAVKTGAAQYVLPPDQIVHALLRMTNKEPFNRD